MNQATFDKERIDPVLADMFIPPFSHDNETHLVASKCNKCGVYFFPKRHICPNCFEEGTLEDKYLSNEASIYTYCVVRAAPVGFDSPYILGYVDLPEGIRIFTMIETDNMDDLKIGARVRLIAGKIRRDENGEDVMGYKFSVIKER